MSYRLIRHKVGDFARWKTVYDAHAGARKTGGSRGARLLRNADDPNEVVILLEWSDLDSAPLCQVGRAEAGHGESRGGRPTRRVLPRRGGVLGRLSPANR